MKKIASERSDMQQQVDSNANILHLPLDLRQGAYGILFHGTNVLVCHTKSGDRIIRNFPGGGVEPGENFETALKREFSEEAGVEPVSVAHFHSSNGLHINPDYPKNRIQFHYYLVEVKGDVNFEGNGDDVGRLEWIPLNELPLKDMLEPDREVAEILRDKTLNEAQKSTGVFPEKKEQAAGQYHNLPIEADKKLYSDFQEAVGRLRCLDISEQTRIQTALLLMFKAHASQEPRPNGEAYIVRPVGRESHG